MYKKEFLSKVTFCLFVLCFVFLSIAQPHTVIFSHGLGSRGKSASYFNDLFTLKQNQLITFDYPDVTAWEKANLGQKIDMETLEKIIQETLKQNKKIILLGVSRGASTIINLLGTKKFPNIAAIILIAPFSSIQDIIKHEIAQRARKAKLSFLKEVASFFLTDLISLTLLPHDYKSYNPFGVQPIKVAHKIDKKIPVFLISSKKDELCPSWGVEKLYKKMNRNRKQKNVHLLMLKEASHNGYTTPGPFAKIKKAINLFYQKYNLPFERKHIVTRKKIGARR